jgi:PKD repeat protein
MNTNTFFLVLCLTLAVLGIVTAPASADNTAVATTVPATEVTTAVTTEVTTSTTAVPTTVPTTDATTIVTTVPTTAAITVATTVPIAVATTSAVPAPVAAFSATPVSGTAPLIVQFTDQSTNSPLYWGWSFGDGNTSTVQNPAYTYPNAGTYTVTLTATNAAGSNVCTKSNYVTVTSTASAIPVPVFSATPLSGSSPLTVQFTDLSTGSPTSWSWNFGDGNSSTLENPSNVYSGDGTYTVTLTETNAIGSNTTTQSGYVVVGAVVAPVADFSASPTAGTAPLIVQFTDSSAGSPTSWSWDFGDGTTVTDENPTHTYTSAGTYSVTLTATNSLGSNTSVESDYILVAGNTAVTATETAEATSALSYTPASTQVPGYTYAIPSGSQKDSVSGSSSGSKSAAGSDAWVEEENKKMEAMDAETSAAPQQTDVITSVVGFFESLFSWI